MVSRLIAVESAIQALRESKTRYHRKTVPFLTNHIEQQSALISSHLHLIAAVKRLTEGETEESVQAYNETIPAVLAHTQSLALRENLLKSLCGLKIPGRAVCARCGKLFPQAEAKHGCCNSQCRKKMLDSSYYKQRQQPISKQIAGKIR